MAQQLTPDQDPVVSKSYATFYFIATILLIATLLWALWDEFYGQRPWKSYQEAFVARYLAFLEKDVRPQSKEALDELTASEGYRKLDQQYQQAMEAIADEQAEIQKKLDEVQAKILAVQNVFTDRRAKVTALIYQAETASSESARKDILEDVTEEQKKTVEVDIPGEGEQEFDYAQLEEKYNSLKDERTQLNVQLGELLKPANEIKKKRDDYVADRMVTLTPEQVAGLKAKYRVWVPEIRQIHVMEADLVDRCESCHMGVREPVKLTPASLSQDPEHPDMYGRAFVSHPRAELLTQHDPQKFGCSPCHGGNGRATTSVVKGHGRHKFWLWPLWHKENVEAGCQQCHAADIYLPGNAVINEGKRLFMVRGCMGCHRYEGYDHEPELLSSLQQQIKQLERQKSDNLRDARFAIQKADNPQTPQAEAEQLYQKAEALRVGVSGIEARLEQLDLQSKSVLRDIKKVGPNLKEVRAKLNKRWIPVWLAKPTDFRPTTKMPNFRLNQEQIHAISAYLWQTALPDNPAPQPPGNAQRGKELFETRGCMGCHSMGEGENREGGDFAANLSRLGEKANYAYIVRWVHNPRQRLRPYCPYEKKDIGPEDYARKGLPYVFDFDHTTCPNDGHELQVQQMTVMPSLRLTEEEARDVASYLMTRKQKEPADYPEAAFMEDPKLKEQGAFWIRHFGCAGCHEIAGFEDEGRIGTELTVEGEKPLERLDFALLTHDAERGVDPFTGKKTEPWYDHKGFFEKKLHQPNIFDKGKIRGEMEKLRMPDPHLTEEQIRALTTFLLGSQKLPLPENYEYKPTDERRAVQEGWWVVKKYNCMGCHQFVPGQETSLMQVARYQDPDWREQLPPKLLTEGARVDPNWLLKFLHNPALSETDTHRNGVRPYLKARMPTFFFSDNELRILVNFFEALSKQAQPYIPQKLAGLTAKEQEMARSLFTSNAAPCLKCHATGDPGHDATATAPNFLLAKERLKPGWTERWLVDPQAISPGTSMPSGLFRREGSQWVFNGPVPPSFEGYERDHTELLVRYLFQLTPNEQRRVSGRLGRASAGLPSGDSGSR